MSSLLLVAQQVGFLVPGHWLSSLNGRVPLVLGRHPKGADRRASGWGVHEVGGGGRLREETKVVGQGLVQFIIV